MAEMAVNLEIVKAEGLRDADWIGSSDPYVLVRHKETKTELFRTKISKDGKNPVWNEGKQVNGVIDGDVITFEVFDDDDNKDDDSLGKCEYTLGLSFEGAVDLIGGKGAKLYISISSLIAAGEEETPKRDSVASKASQRNSLASKRSSKQAVVNLEEENSSPLRSSLKSGAKDQALERTGTMKTQDPNEVNWDGFIPNNIMKLGPDLSAEDPSKKNPVICAFPRGEEGFGYEFKQPGEEDMSAHECLYKRMEENAAESQYWNHLGVLGGGEWEGQKYSEKECYEKAIELEWNNYDAWNNLGGAGGSEKHPQKECWEKWLKWGVDAETLNNLGACGGGKVEARELNTKECFEESIKMKRIDAKAWHNLGVIGGGNVDGTEYTAKECFEESLDLKPENAQCLNNLGVCGGGKVGSENYTAPQCFEKALALDPENATNWHNVALNTENAEARREGLQKAIQLKPDVPEFWNSLGQNGGGTINDEKVSPKECFEKACALDSKDAQAWISLADHGGTDEFPPYNCVQKALELDRDFPTAWLKLGMLGGGSVDGKEYDSKNAVIRALELKHDFGEAWNNLAIHEGGEVSGREYSQIDCLQNATDMAPMFAEPWFNLAALGGIEDDAKKNENACWQNVARIDPEDSEAWYRLGLAGGFDDPEKGRISAERCLSQAAELGHADAPNHLEFVQKSIKKQGSIASIKSRGSKA